MKPERINRIEIMFSYACNNKCIFCLEKRSRQNEKNNSSPYSLRFLSQFLRKNRNTCESVFFTGGEPAISPLFYEALSIAKGYGYRTHVSTNATIFASREFASQTVPHIDEVIVSIHGDTQALHELHTKSPGSFRKTITGLRNILSLKPGINLLSNSVVTRSNFPYLPRMIAYVRSLGIRRILLSNMVPISQTDVFVLNKMVRLRDWSEKIPLLFNSARKSGVAIKIFGVPPCLIGTYIDFLDDFGNEAKHIYNRIELREGKISLLPMSRLTPLATKTKACKQCLRRGSCTGIFKFYYKKYGDSELKPIKVTGYDL